MAPQPARSIGTRIADLASGRKAMVDRLELLQARPRPLEEAAADIERMVARAGATVDPPLVYLTHRGDASQVTGLLASLRRSSTPQHPGSPGAFELLCFLAPDQVTARLSDELRRTYARLPPPIAGADFVAAESELQRGIAAVEAEIASLWWQSVEGGSLLPPPEISAAVLLGISQ